jgi:hypothetical protein
MKGSPCYTGSRMYGTIGKADRNVCKAVKVKQGLCVDLRSVRSTYVLMAFRIAVIVVTI